MINLYIHEKTTKKINDSVGEYCKTEGINEEYLRTLIREERRSQKSRPGRKVLFFFRKPLKECLTKAKC